MLNVSEEVKTLYELGNVPLTLQLRIGNTLYTDSNVVAGSVSITESLCSLETFTLSAVEKNELVFSLFNEEQQISDLIGQTVVASHVVTLDDDTTETVPLGTYTIADAVNDGDYIITCTCYDGMLAFDKVVDTWWNETVEFPITIKNLVKSLFEEVNVQYDLPAEFTNFNFEITTRPTFFDGIKASEILGYIQEIAGGFFKVNRFGIVKFLGVKQISAYGLYPKIGLYPKSDLYPTTSDTVGFGEDAKLNEYSYRQIFGELTVADYAINAVTALQIRGTESDVGITVGTGSDVFVIEGNPLLYNITGDDLVVAENILDVVKNITYVPFTGEFTALPYLEVGDCVYAVTYKGKKIKSPILYRVLNNQKLSVDNFTTKGTKQRQNKRTFNSTITTISQRTHEMKNTVDELSSTVSNVELRVNTNETNITQNAKEISLTAKRSGIFNLLVNSDFSNQTDHTQSWSTKYLATEYVYDEYFKGDVGDITGLENGYCLKVTPTSSGNQMIYQEINYTGEISQKLTGQITYRVLNAEGANLQPFLRVYSGSTSVLYIFVASRFTLDGRVHNMRWILADSTLEQLAGVEVTKIQYGVFIQNPTLSTQFEINHLLLTFSESVLPFYAWTNYANKDLISQINVQPDGVKIMGSKIDIYGLTTFHNSDGTGGTTIDGATLTAGTINGTAINGVTITGSEIDSGDMYWFKGTANEAKMTGEANIVFDGASYSGVMLSGSLVHINAKNGLLWLQNNNCGIWIHGTQIGISRTNGGGITVDDDGVKINTENPSGQLKNWYLTWRQVKDVDGNVRWALCAR